MARRRRTATLQPFRQRNTRDIYTPGPPPPQPQPMPLDPAYDLGVASVHRDYELAQGNIQYGQGRTKQEYGFDDLSNPFSKATLLKRLYEQGQRGNLNQMASGGQLYSGALQRQQDEGTFQFQRSSDALKREYEDKMHGYQSQLAMAEADRGAGMAGLFGERLDRASQQRTDPGPAPRARATPRRRGRRRRSYDSWSP